MGVQLHQTGGMSIVRTIPLGILHARALRRSFLKKELITTTAIVSRIKRCTRCVFPAC